MRSPVCVGPKPCPAGRTPFGLGRILCSRTVQVPRGRLTLGRTVRVGQLWRGRPRTLQVNVPFDPGAANAVEGARSSFTALEHRRAG
jgi:hypothetical protein